MKIDKNDNLTDLVDGLASEDEATDSKGMKVGEVVTEDGDLLRLGNPYRSRSRINEDMHELEESINKHWRENWGKTIAVPTKKI